jgi:uncharacterized protein involved in exopolysaccharide biosynthesis
MRTAGYDIVHVIFKRQRIVWLTLVLVLTPTILAALWQPTVYRATSRLMVTQARAYPQLTPEQEARNVPVNDLQFVEATAQTLRTRSFLREAAAVIVENGDDEAAESDAENDATEKSAGWWTQRLAKRLEVTAISGAPLIEVAYRAEDPERSAEVVNKVVEHYVKYQARTIFDHPALRQFYERQREQLALDLQNAESALVQFQEENEIFSLDVQRDGLARAHAEALHSLDLNAGQIRQAETNALALAAQLEKLPPQVALHTYGDGPRLNALGQKVVELELELSDLRQLYTDEDRRVKDKLEELSRAEELLVVEEAAAGDTPTATRLESNDAYQNVLENALREDASAQALRARREEIETRVAATAQRLETFNRMGYEYERLKVERDARQASYTHLLALLQKARTSEAMDQEGLTNVHIVDRASPPQKPVPNRRWLTLAMGLFTSLAVAIGGAFGLEALSPTVHSEQDAEERLALPVLGVIPEDA